MPSNIPHNIMYVKYLQLPSCNSHKVTVVVSSTTCHYYTQNCTIPFCFPFRDLFLIPTRCTKIECAISKKPVSPKIRAYLLNIL